MFYVGKGSKRRYKDLCERNRYFIHIVNKVGMDNIRIDICEENLCEQDAFEKEIEYIAHYKNISPCLTNMTSGGEGSSDWYEHLSDEEKQKHREISKSFLGRKHSEETKLKMSKSAMGVSTMTDSGKQALREFRSKPVVVFEDGKISERYSSITECQRHYMSLGEHSISTSCIKNALKRRGSIKSSYKRHQIHKNKKFMYEEELLSLSTIEKDLLDVANKSIE